jgi:hypothetical protein
MMTLLKDSIPIVTSPLSPQRQLAIAIEKLRAERATLATTFTTVLRALDKLAPGETYLLQLRAAAILHELDLILSELKEMNRNDG